jgi:hypothetical protein
MRFTSIALALCASAVFAQPTPFPTVPTTKTPTTAAPSASPTSNPTYDSNAKIYLYGLSTWPLTGDLGTRVSADWSCTNEATLINLFCQTHSAFISFSASDQVKDLATNHLHCSDELLAVVGPTGLPIVDKWTDLFVDPLPNSLASAHVLGNAEWLENAFFSGSNSDGTFAGYDYSCEQWTNSAPVSGARLGNADSTDASYLNYIDGSCDGEAASAVLTKSRIVCACFHDGS